MILLRQLLGDVLRRMRVRQGRTLREVSASARVSLGYLSEVERGRKEASSELLAAICAALDTPLSQVFREVSDNFALAELQNEPVLSRRAARARAAHPRRAAAGRARGGGGPRGGWPAGRRPRRPRPASLGRRGVRQQAKGRTAASTPFPLTGLRSFRERLGA